MTSELRVNNVGKLAQAQLPRSIAVLYVLLFRRWQDAMHSPRTESEYCIVSENYDEVVSQ